MGHLYNEAIQAETDPAGRLTAYEWRGSRYTVHGVLKSYDTERSARILRVRVTGDDGMAVAEVVREDDHWRIRHVFPA